MAYSHKSEKTYKLQFLLNFSSVIHLVDDLLVLSTILLQGAAQISVFQNKETSELKDGVYFCSSREELDYERHAMSKKAESMLL